MRALDIAIKDITQMLRDWRLALFMVIMPIGFTVLFGFMFGGFSAEEEDPRLPVGYLDQDQGTVSANLEGLFSQSSLIRLEARDTEAELVKGVEDSDLAAAVIVPAGYSQNLLADETGQLIVILDPNSDTTFSVQSEIEGIANRLQGAVRTALVSAKVYEDALDFQDEAARSQYINTTVERVVQAYQSPPVKLAMAQTGQEEQEAGMDNAFAQSSPGMMAQFCIAGLMSAANLLVLERKSRSLQRMMTTPVTHPHILLGHFLAMFIIIFAQLLLLIVFGQLLLQLDYFGQPVATLLITVAAALFAAGLGLAIGTGAKTEEQVIVFTLLPMFVLAGLGGAWMPLEFTSETVQKIGHLSPIAWMMDGYKNILVRGQGIPEALLPAAVLTGFSFVFIVIATWLFRARVKNG